MHNKYVSLNKISKISRRGLSYLNGKWPDRMQNSLWLVVVLTKLITIARSAACL